jgi:hypothetical protein
MLGTDTNSDTVLDSFYTMSARGSLKFNVTGVTKLRVSVSNDQWVDAGDHSKGYKTINLDFDLAGGPGIEITKAMLDAVGGAGWGTNLSAVTFVVDNHMSLTDPAVKVVTVATKNLGYVPASGSGQASIAFANLTDMQGAVPGTLNSSLITGLGRVAGHETDQFTMTVSGVPGAGSSVYDGSILMLGTDTNSDTVLDSFYSMVTRGSLKFNVTGVTKLRVSVSNDQWVDASDHTKGYKTINLDFNLAGGPGVEITKAMLDAVGGAGWGSSAAAGPVQRPSNRAVVSSRMVLEVRMVWSPG